jgi:hypothetical protein
MTSRRSPPRRSSGSRAAVALAAVSCLSGLAGARAEEPGSPAALVESRDGVEIDWGAGTLTASGGAAADLHLPGADLARPGAVRRAEAAARARLERALAALPLGGERTLSPADVARALARARTTATEYQSNGGAVVRVTARFIDWLEPAPAAEAPPVATFAVPAMRLVAAPLAKVGDVKGSVGAAVYRLGAPPAAAKAIVAKVDHAGRLVLEAQPGGPSAKTLTASAALIYVGKVLK